MVLHRVATCDQGAMTSATRRRYGAGKDSEAHRKETFSERYGWYDPCVTVGRARRFSKGLRGMETRRVLLVDDDPEAVKVAVSLLRDEPYRLLWATTARDGLRLVRQHTPDLIVLSWTLPEMTGDQFAEILENDPATASIPLVLFSLEPWVFGAHHRTRAAQVVNKSTMVEDLAPRVRDALGLAPAPNTPSDILAQIRDRSQWWAGEQDDDWRLAYRQELRASFALGA